MLTIRLKNKVMEFKTKDKKIEIPQKLIFTVDEYNDPKNRDRIESLMLIYGNIYIITDKTILNKT